MNQIDQLSPEEQSLVKCAAVIGHSFHIDLLQHLLPGWSKDKLLEVLKDLVDMHVLRWCHKGQELPAEPVFVPSSVETEHTQEKTKSGELVPCSQAQIESFGRRCVCSKRTSILCVMGPSLLKLMSKELGKLLF